MLLFEDVMEGTLLCLLPCIKREIRDFSGDIVDRNPPASAGDTGSIPGPGRFHILRSN